MPLEVKPGDRLVVLDNRKPKRFVTVKRVLKQYFETENGEKWNFMGKLRSRERTSYDWLTVEHMTPEAEAVLLRKQWIERISCTRPERWEKLSDEQLQKVIGALNSTSGQ